MEFRKLEEKDAADYWRLRLEALETEPLAFGTDAEEHRATSVEEMAARIRGMRAGSFMLGGFDDGAMVATATFSREENRKERHKGHIYGVYVAGTHRGRGVGKELLGVLLGEATLDQSLDHILLGVGTYNTAAIRTYQGLGFTISGTERRALKVGEEFVDEHQMVLFPGAK